MNEYYAYKLELERRFNGDREKFEELLGDLGTKRIELEALFGGVGQAIAAKLREHWGLGRKPSNYVFPFREAYDCLEHAPGPPELPRRAKPFTLNQRNEIKGLLRESFPRIYPGGQIQFLEIPN